MYNVASAIGTPSNINKQLMSKTSITNQHHNRRDICDIRVDNNCGLIIMAKAQSVHSNECRNQQVSSMSLKPYNIPRQSYWTASWSSLRFTKAQIKVLAWIDYILLFTTFHPLTTLKFTRPLKALKPNKTKASMRYSNANCCSYSYSPEVRLFTIRMSSYLHDEFVSGMAMAI